MPERGVLKFSVGIVIGLLISSIFVSTYSSYVFDVIGKYSSRYIVSGSNSKSNNNAKSHDVLYNKVRVLCWIMTAPRTLQSKASHVRDTWAHRCNKVLFMSSEYDPKFPTVKLNVSEGRQHLTEKTMHAFAYIYENHMDDADWFMKADDDTFAILENLRYFLKEKNPNDPIYFGRRFELLVKNGYPSGGGGYVLSKEAMRRFGSMGLKDEKKCAPKGAFEDVEIGKCMQNLGVTLKPSIDSKGRSRFHAFNPETMFRGKFNQWYHDHDYEGAKGGVHTVSDYPITFHYVTPEQMHFLEYYVYRLQAFGHPYGKDNLNAREPKKQHEMTWPMFILVLIMCS